MSRSIRICRGIARLLIQAELLVLSQQVSAATFADAAPSGTTTAFQHPGLLNNMAELKLIKDRLQSKADPWQTALSKLKASDFARLQWKAKPRPVVEVGFYNKPDLGGSDELNDATAAYVHTLIWIFTGEEEHAAKAMEILEEWSGTLQSHRGDNAKLQAAWAGCVFPLSAEILRSTYPKWTNETTAGVVAMFNRAFVPLFSDDMPLFNGNWDLSMSNALIAIGVFNDKRALYEKGVSRWRKRIPAYFYLSRDGPLPIPPDRVEFMASSSYWNNPGRFVDGLCQETGRDLGHVQMGLAASVNGAEIAYHQGLNLYSEEAPRIAAAMEFHANFLLGNSVPPWLCGGKLNVPPTTNATWEVAYNHFRNRMHLDLPLTHRLILEKVRPSPRISVLNTAGTDTLTHAEVDNQPTGKKSDPGSGL